MKPSLRPRTLFSKFFLILLLSGVATQVAVAVILIVFLAPKPNIESRMRANIDLYASLLADELARNPSREHAMSLLKGTEVDVKVNGAAGWETSPLMERPVRALASSPRGDAFQIVAGRPFIERDRTGSEGPLHFFFLGPEGPPLIPMAGILLFGLFIIVIVFLLASASAYRVLRPVSVLAQAFHDMKGGDWNRHVPVTGQDELGRLSHAFNEMAEHIRFLLQDKEQMLLEISHEFRSPLARVSAASSLIADTELYDAIQKEVKDLDSLIHALVTASKMEAKKADGEMESLELDALITDTISRFPDSERRIRFTAEGKPLLFLGNRRSLQILIKNLIENALKYSPPHDLVQVSCRREGNEIFLSVEDKGQGIPKEELKNVFQPFYRSQEARAGQPGFGLGLGLCKRIVQAHGATLELLSEGPGTGTRALVRLPRSEAR